MRVTKERLFIGVNGEDEGDCRVAALLAKTNVKLAYGSLRAPARQSLRVFKGKHPTSIAGPPEGYPQKKEQKKSKEHHTAKFLIHPLLKIFSGLPLFLCYSA